MAGPQLALLWDDHQSNICSGLGMLQQRGEFVDMTLAADGHHVKVHQMVMCLVSPYIKELISSAQCPHPVIFLNNISYTTLSAILEYIYKGEVLISREQLCQLIAAGKALHIKGLKDMESAQSEEEKDPISETSINPPQESLFDKLRDLKESKKHNVKFKEERTPICKVFVDVSADEPPMDTDDYQMDSNETSVIVSPVKVNNVSTIENKAKMEKATNGNNSVFSLKSSPQHIQYSVSNQGGLQIIVNRYIYTLKYIQKKLLRVWRCVDSAYKKCPANIYTNEKNEVVKRTFTHNHPFHDEKILKKIRRGSIFVAYNEAASMAQDKRIESKEKKKETEKAPPLRDTDSE